MLRAVRTLMLGGLAGKILGIARELLTAALFGTGPIAAAYRLAQAAFLIPLHGLLSDAFGAGFTPAYARRRAARADEARLLFAAMHAVVLGISVVVGLWLVWVAAHWVRLLAPGFEPATAVLAERMVMVLALAMPFYALTGLYSSAEIATGRAGLAGARASVQSIGLMAGTLLAWWSGEPLYIACGFLCAYVLLAASGLRNALAQGLRPWPRRAEWGAASGLLGDVWRAVRVLLLVPVLLQIHFVVERRVASVVSADTVAALDYARFLSDTAVLLLAVPLGIAGLGGMATMSDARFRDVAQRSLRMLLYAGVPLSLAAALHGETIVRLVYARGAFDAGSVAVTTAILQWLAIGLWAQLVGYAGAKFLSARGRNPSVIVVYAAGVGVNVALNIVLQPLIGAAALGVAAAANSLVFGIGILLKLGVLARMQRDLATAGLLAGAYGLIWIAAPPDVAASAWLPLVGFAAYWCSAGLLVPRCRAVLHEAWLALRAA
jgi:putative peptidoglycan lipid II flippase